MKNPNESIGNRTSVLPAYSAVQQPNAPPHTPNLRCKKYNIFPVHAMKAYGEIRTVRPLILNLGTSVMNVKLHISAIYPPRRKKNPCIHSTESWVGLTAGLEVLEKKIVFCAYRNLKPDLIIPNAIKSILLFYSNGFVPLFLAVTLFTFRKGLFTGRNFKIPYRHTCNLWLTKSILCLRYRKATVFLCTKCCIPSSNISLTIFMKPQV